MEKDLRQDKKMLKGGNMVVRVRLKNGVFEPLEQLDAYVRKLIGEEFEVEILPKLDSLEGALKGIKMTSVELQHKIKDMW
jgi:predicted DNA-binding antitoxin AbrB/MazE fold protein